MTHVFLVGGSRLLRHGLKVALEEAGSEVLGEFSSVEHVASSEDRHETPLVYLVKHTPGNSTIRQDIATLRRNDPEARIAVMVPALTASDLVDAFGAGSDALFLEEISIEALNESLKLVELGEKVFPSQLATLLDGNWPATERNRFADTRGNKLTDREVEIVCCLTRGMPNKAIARELDLAVATVKVHIKSLLKKLGLRNRTQAAIWAIDTGLAVPPAVTVDRDDAPGDESDAEQQGEVRPFRPKALSAPALGNMRLLSSR